jgi:hypothetical protein
MAISFLPDSSYYPSTHPIVVSVTIKYNINGLSGTGGASRGGFNRHYLIFSKASSHSSFQILGFFFLNKLKIGLQVVVNWDINRAM